MWSIMFYAVDNQGLVELMFDKEEEAIVALDSFTVAHQDIGGVLTINSKYGTAVLNLQHYGGALMTNIDETEQMSVILGARRGRIDFKMKEEFEKWAKIRSSLQSGVMGSSM